MTNRRAVLSILLILIISVFTVVGCGGGSSGYNLSGRWAVTILYTDGFTEVWIFNLTQDKDTLTGTSKETGEPETIPVSGMISGESVTITENWPDGYRYRYSGTIRSDNLMEGNCAGTDGSDPGAWTARKE